MNIAVLGANGRSGQAFVRLALQSGHRVWAGVYGTHNFKSHERLAVLCCNALSQKDVERLVENVDAVVSLIGHVGGSPAFVQTNAIKHVTLAMEKFKVLRLVSLTGTGVRVPGDQVRLLDRILNAGISLIDPARVRDGKEHFKVMQDSSVEWTLIRVLKLTNRQEKPFKLTEHGPAKLFTSRQEVARAILQVLTNPDDYMRKAPIIANV